MKTAKDYLESEVKRLIDQAREVTRKAEEENRGLSDEERMKVEGLISETNTLKSRIQEQEDNEKLLQALNGASAIQGGEPTVGSTEAKTIGEAFVKSDGYRALRKRGLVGAWTSGPIAFGTKLTDDDGNTVVSEDGSNVFGTGTSQLQPQVIPGIQGPVEQRLTVADLLGSGTTSTNAIVYLKETVTVNGVWDSGTNAYTLTSEGGEKPASEIDFDKVTASVDKIATFLPIREGEVALAA